MLWGLMKANEGKKTGEEAARYDRNDHSLDSFFASSPPASTSHDYPLVLTGIADATAIVVGGGAVGERKVRGLLAAGAAVRLISPAASEQLRAWAAEGRLGWEPRPYAPGDLAGARLAFAASNQRSVNAEVAQEAAKLGVLCNVADAPAEGSFHVPALHRAPGLTIAVSTGGAAPARAAAIRDAIARWLAAGAPEKYDDR
jgi:cobalt-precorrin 5A hydrolase/precorrin-3B C17-methyltransferase